MSAARSEEPRGTQGSGGHLVPLGSEGTDIQAKRDDGDDYVPGGDEYKVVLEVLRGMAAQEFDRSERFGTRARQAFAFSAAFFAVVQTVALNSFVSDNINDAERKTLLILAIIAGSLVTICGILLVFADSVRRAKDITPDEVLKTANEAIEHDEPVALELSGLYATVVEVRRATNTKRTKWVMGTQALALVSALAVLTELIYALNARI